jgi:hypothetical protein
MYVSMIEYTMYVSMIEHSMYVSMIEYTLLGWLKGLSYEIFGPVFLAVRMYLGLNVNRLWFLNFNDAPLILDNYFRF